MSVNITFQNLTSLDIVTDLITTESKTLTLPASTQTQASLPSKVTGFTLTCSDIFSITLAQVRVNFMIVFWKSGWSDQWMYSKPYDAATFALISVNTDGVVIISPFNMESSPAASSTWVGTQPVFNNTTPVALMPYVPFRAFGQYYAQATNGACQMAFGNTAQWYAQPSSGTPVAPTEQWVQLVPGFLPQTYVLQQVLADYSTSTTPSPQNQYFGIQQGGVASATLACVANIASAAIVFVSLTLTELPLIGVTQVTFATGSGVVLTFQDANTGSLWQLDPASICSIASNSASIATVQLVLAYNSANTDTLTLPGFALNTAPSNTPEPARGFAPLTTLLLYYNQDIAAARASGQLNCFQPLDVGCGNTSGACLFKDTPAGSALCGTSLTRMTTGEANAVQAFWDTTCVTFTDSGTCVATGTSNTQAACALIGLNPTSSDCAAAQTTICATDPSAVECRPASPPKPSDGLPTWAWIAIGGGAAVLLAIILAAVLIPRARRAKQLKLKNHASKT